MNIENKIAVVTGGAGGIGSALCKALADKGARVVVSDLNLDAAQSVASEVNGLAIACDVSRESEINNLIHQVESQLGDIDHFVSNAGFGVGEPDHAASASNDVWQKNWELHVMSHVWASRALLPKMIERGDGYLVNTVQFSEIKDLGGKLLPSVMEFLPEENPGHKTVIKYHSVDYNISLSEKFFSIKNMKRVRLSNFCLCK